VARTRCCCSSPSGCSSGRNRSPDALSRSLTETNPPHPAPRFEPAHQGPAWTRLETKVIHSAGSSRRRMVDRQGTGNEKIVPDLTPSPNAPGSKGKGTLPNSITKAKGLQVTVLTENDHPFTRTEPTAKEPSAFFARPHHRHGAALAGPTLDSVNPHPRPTTTFAASWADARPESDRLSITRARKCHRAPLRAQPVGLALPASRGRGGGQFGNAFSAKGD